MDIAALSSSLRTDATGIWVSQHRANHSISFPASGHADCFRIEENSFWFAHRNKCISRAISGSPFEGPFLDVGGGNGVVSEHLQSDGIETVVLEPGLEGAANAKRRGIRHVVCATLDEARFAPGAFGGAGLFDVIEHVEDDGALLRATHAVLRRDGVLAVTVPAYDALWSAEDDAAGHHRRYTERTLRAVLERSGFTVDYATYFFAPLTVPLFFARSLRYRLGLRRGTDPSRVQQIQEEAARHHTPSPLARLAMNALLEPEVKRVRERRSIPFGTSCLAIAHAK